MPQELGYLDGPAGPADRAPRGLHGGGHPLVLLVEDVKEVAVDEVERRDGKQLDVRVRRAGFEAMRSLEDFDFHRAQWRRVAV